MNKLTDTIKLANGYEIPCVGFGTWQTPGGEVAVESVKNAIKAGYRHIDTAAIYGNEESVGKGIIESGVDRKELFITSKLWNTERGYDKTIKAFHKTLEDLKLDYLDLYLIHWPAVKNQFDNYEELNLSTWQAITDLYEEGKIKAIGVSNFMVHHIKPLMETKIKPMVNQIEFHPGFMQKEIFDFCKQNNIVVEAWSPLGCGDLLNNEKVVEIAKKYNKSTAQLLIRWSLQHGAVPLPKSVTASRIEENTKVFDFVISDEDMKTINDLPFSGGSGSNPDEVDF